MAAARCPLLLEREHESAVLASLLGSLFAGSGGALTLIGNTGLGKTRLATELARAAAARGAVVLWAGVEPDGVWGEPFGALSRIVRAAVTADVSDTVGAAELFGRARAALGLEEELPALVPSVVDLLPEPVAVRGLVAELVEQLCQRLPVVIVFDDLHFAAPETAATARLLARETANRPLLVVVAAEPEAGVDLGVGPRLELAPLSESAVRQMLESCWRDDHVPDELASLVSEHASGVPLLVEELLAAVVDGETRSRRAEGSSRVDLWSSTGDRAQPELGVRRGAKRAPGVGRRRRSGHSIGQGRSPVPTTLPAAIEARLCGREAVRQVLEVAAVLGATFEWRIVAEVAALPEREVLDALQDAVDLGLLGPDDDPDAELFHFRSPATRSAVLSQMRETVRRGRAGAALTVLEQRFPGLPGQRLTQAAALANHAGARDQASRLWCEAGRRCLALGAYQEAGQCFERAGDGGGEGRSKRMLFTGRGLEVAVDRARAWIAAGHEENIAKAREALRQAAHAEATKNPGDGRQRAVAAHAAVGFALLSAGRAAPAAEELARARAVSELAASSQDAHHEGQGRTSLKGGRAGGVGVLAQPEQTHLVLLAAGVAAAEGRWAEARLLAEQVATAPSEELRAAASGESLGIDPMSGPETAPSEELRAAAAGMWGGSAREGAGASAPSEWLRAAASAIWGWCAAAEMAGVVGVVAGQTRRSRRSDPVDAGGIANQEIVDLGSAIRRLRDSAAMADRTGPVEFALHARRLAASIAGWSSLDPMPLESVRDAAVAARLPRLVVTVDAELAELYVARWDRERAHAALVRGRRLAERLGMLEVSSQAALWLAIESGVAALAGDRAAVDVFGARLDELDASDAVRLRWLVNVAMVRLVEADTAGALAALDQTGTLASGPLDGATSPIGYRPFAWQALLRAALEAEQVQPRSIRGVGDNADVHPEASSARRGGEGNVDRWSPAFEWEQPLQDCAAALEASRAGDRGAAQEAAARGLARLAAFGETGARYVALWLVSERASADGWGEPERWSREAVRWFEESGYPRLAAACRSVLRSTGAKVPRRGRGESKVPSALAGLGLTSREVDVLALVAEGLTNKEVARRLFISARTVGTHVAHLLAKTGSRNRRQLRELAHRHGLTER